MRHPPCMTAAHVGHHISFQDTLQAVPQLLEACVIDCVGVKCLRLSSKTASTLALQAIRSYCIELAPEPSETEPLQDVGRLLQHARLRHLRVDISVPETYRRYHGVGAAPPPGPPHELTSQVAQMQAFVSAIGTALTSVTSLEITFSMCECRLPYDSQYTTCSFPGELSEKAGSEFATILMAACPAIRQVKMAGGLGDAAMRLFGSGIGWPAFTILDVPEDGTWLNLFGKSKRDILLPCVTHMRLVNTQQCTEDFLEIALYTSLTHLELGDGWLEEEFRWLLLPPNLHMLRCGEFPQALPPLLRMDHLKAIHVTDSRTDSVDVEILASLLRAAPALQLLITLHGIWNTISIRSCTPSVLEDLQLVSKRIEAGFQMQGVDNLDSDWDCLPPRPKFGIGGYPVPTGGVRRPLPNSLDLGRPPRIYTIDACNFQPRKHDGNRANCLGMVARCFPDLKKLELRTAMMRGSWQDASLNEPLTFTFPNLRMLRSMDDSPPSNAILQLVACMPQLTMLKHSKAKIKEEDEVFGARLHATQVIAAAGDSVGANVLGDWTMHSHWFWQVEWTREVLGVSPLA